MLSDSYCVIGQKVGVVNAEKCVTYAAVGGPCEYLSYEMSWALFLCSCGACAGFYVVYVISRSIIRIVTKSSVDIHDPQGMTSN